MAKRCITIAICASLAVALLSARDAPYTELISMRNVYEGVWARTPVPTGWGALSAQVTSVASTFLQGSADQDIMCWTTAGLMSGPTCNASVSAPQCVYSAGSGQARVVTGALDDPRLAGLLAIVSTSGYCVYTCSVGVSCSMLAAGALQRTTAAAAALSPGPGGYGIRLWLGDDSGTYVVALGNDTCNCVETQLPDAANAIAYSVALARVAIGNAEKLALYDATTLALQRFEWVTLIAQGWGGPVDDAITALAYAPDGTLYIGNPTCLNIMFTNSTIIRVAGAQGLPMGNITSLACDQRQGEWPPRPPGMPRIWIGTDAGAILFDPLAAVENGGVSWIDTSTITLQQRWRYLNGPRYLVPSPSALVATRVLACGMASAGNNTIVLTPGGLAVLQAQSWTLGQKAAWYEGILLRHDRANLGLIADCSMPAFGLVANCTNAPSESNGIWTGLQLAAESLRFSVTSDPAALDAAHHLGLGMQLLVNITGIRGLPARSAVSPAEGPAPSGSNWHNSTVYPGWAWMGDTSSDSTTGHMFAYAVYAAALERAAFLHDNAGPVNATGLLLDIATYIVVNNFTLVDITGLPTKWGHWDPATLNVNRAWSDGRGVNSMQILSYLAAGLTLADPASRDGAILRSGLQQLLAPGVHYPYNTVNLKIEAPSDENFSDDELSFLPYYIFCSSPSPLFDTVRPFVQLSVTRSYAFVRSWRPSLWTLIANACNVSEVASQQEMLEDVWWNLATWPLELVDWPTQNSQRLDITVNPNVNRDGQFGTESIQVLPANERDQFRWNSDPYTLDDGTGFSEFEPGAWLLPFWMARAQGWLAG